MNFKKIIEHQKILDEKIKQTHSINSDITKNILIALYTEVGEFANEVQSFKYWKKSKKINQNDLLEEYADGIHFLMSFAIKVECDIEIESNQISNDINEQFLAVFNSISKLTKKVNKKNVQKTIALYLGLAKLLNISDDLIHEAYVNKNKKNFERIKNNY